MEVYIFCDLLLSLDLMHQSVPSVTQADSCGWQSWVFCSLRGGRAHGGKQEESFWFLIDTELVLGDVGSERLRKWGFALVWRSLIWKQGLFCYWVSRQISPQRKGDKTEGKALIGKETAVTPIYSIKENLVMVVVWAIFMFCWRLHRRREYCWFCLDLSQSQSGIFWRRPVRNYLWSTAHQGVGPCEWLKAPGWLLDIGGCLSLSQMLMGWVCVITWSSSFSVFTTQECRRNALTWIQPYFIYLLSMDTWGVYK